MEGNGEQPSMELAVGSHLECLYVGVPWHHVGDRLAGLLAGLYNPVGLKLGKHLGPSKEADD